MSDKLLNYVVLVLALTVGISILGSVFVDVHPFTMMADRVNDIVAGAGR